MYTWPFTRWIEYFQDSLKTWKREKRQVWCTLYCSSTYLYPTGFFCGWPIRQRSHCSIETPGILPRSEVETLLLRTMWLCSIPPIPCTHSIFQQMSKSKSEPHHAFSHSHVGHRYWVRIIPDVNTLQTTSIHHPDSTFHNTSLFTHTSTFKISRFCLCYTLPQFQSIILFK
jgi:hypothetical protein